jgi:hypothetical protein
MNIFRSQDFANYYTDLRRRSMQFPNNFDAWTGEHLGFVRCVGQFTGQVLTGEMQPLMQFGTPLWAIAHIVDDTVAGDPLGRAAVAVVAAQFYFGNAAVGDGHVSILAQP